MPEPSRALSKMTNPQSGEAWAQEHSGEDQCNYAECPPDMGFPCRRVDHGRERNIGKLRSHDQIVALAGTVSMYSGLSEESPSAWRSLVKVVLTLAWC